MPKQEVRKDINPQLCKTLNPAKHKWDRPWMAEPKLDGLRCILTVEFRKGIKWIGAYSRNGKLLYNIGHILDTVAKNVDTDMVFDGEVYTKDWNLSMGIVKSSVTEHPDAKQIRYNVWDCLTGAEFKSSWKDNRKVSHKIFSGVSNSIRKNRLLGLFDHTEYIKIVSGQVVHNNEELQRAYTEFLAQGYEGAILKDPHGVYEGGRRSPYWLKIKPWSDADLTVVGAFEGEGKHLGRIGGLVLEGRAEWNGSVHQVHTEVGTGFTDTEREFFQALSDNGKLLGRIVEIKFQDITVDGACRFPVYNRLREDKE